MSARMRAHGQVHDVRGRMSGERGNATVLPLLICITALVIAVLLLGMIAIGLGHQTSRPAWSGDQAPPGPAAPSVILPH